MSLEPARRDLSFWRGSTFRKRFTYLTQVTPSRVPKDLTGYTGEFLVRSSIGGEPLPLTSSLTITGSQGAIDILITDENTRTDWRAGVYELAVISPGGDRTVLLWGAIRARGG
jgi:hypothetical protein